MTSISPFDSWPLPAFQLNSRLEIIESSEAARSLFGEASLFQEILDEGSVSKAAEFLRISQFTGPVELNFKGVDGELKLCDLHCKRDGDFILNVIVVPKDDQVAKISSKLSDLRSRLHETNYDLLLEKEQTDKLLQRVRELSAPTIELKERHLLIPFFGDLDAAKIEAIRDHILRDVYEKNAELVILDLTALEEVNSEGMDYLSSLLQTFKVMGIRSIVTGLNPQHAKQLHALRAAVEMQFESSLAAVLSGRGQVM